MPIDPTRPYREVVNEIVLSLSDEQVAARDAAMVAAMKAAYDSVVGPGTSDTLPPNVFKAMIEAVNMSNMETWTIINPFGDPRLPPE